MLGLILVNLRPISSPIWSILVQCSSVLGPSLAHFWVYVGFILSPFWIHYRSVLGQFRSIFGSKMQLFVKMRLFLNFQTTVFIRGKFLLKIDWLEIDHSRFNFLPLKIGSENLGWSFCYVENSRFETIIERDMFNGTHPLYPYPTVQKF